MRLCTASKQHLDGSAGSRALAPPVMKAAAVVLIYRQSDPTLLLWNHSALKSLFFNDEDLELNLVQQRTILLPHLVPLKDWDRSLSTISVLFSHGEGAHFFLKMWP